MSQGNPKGFEALLKPIQDVIAKNWKVRLKNFLEMYINYLHQLGFINFSEAAIILQNTSSFYCKRVDIVYNWVRQFALSLVKNDEISLEDAENQENKKTHKPKKQLELDTLDVLDYCHAGTRFNLKFENIGSKEIRQTLFNINGIEMQRENTACVLLQSNAEEMGYKYEFRLHSDLYKDGRLREVFFPSKAKLIVGLPLTNHVNLDEIAEESSHLEEDFTINDCDDFSDHNETNDHNPNTEEKDYETIPFSSVIMYEKFHKVALFKLPDGMIETVEELRRQEDEIKNCEKKRRKCNDNKNNIDLKEKAANSPKVRKKKSDKSQMELSNNKEDNTEAEKTIEPDAKPVEQDNKQDDEASEGNHDDFIDSHVEDDLEPSISNNYSVTDDYSSNVVDESQLQTPSSKKQETIALQKRVANWHDSMRYRLDIAEKRKDYDSHCIGTEILDKFDEVGDQRSFFQVTQDIEHEDVSRYFLTTLMLANTYNIEITKTDPEELAKDCMQLTLLSTVRHHDELDTSIGAAAAAGSYF